LFHFILPIWIDLLLICLQPAENEGLIGWGVKGERAIDGCVFVEGVK